MRPGTLESLFHPASSVVTSLKTSFPYCALGAVSPDYPNLVTGDTHTSCWADAMHFSRVRETINSGINFVRKCQGDRRSKQMAWLLGYCAHVGADMTIHPVVQEKVGAYAENQRQHRVCEMNQDSYIYGRMNLGEIGASDIFARTVVQCGSPVNTAQLDSDIESMWDAVLKDIHPELYDAHPPEISAWHAAFVIRVAECSAAVTRLFPLAGIISEKMGLSYPCYAAIDRQFIDEQRVPSEKPQSLGYDEIFDHAVDNVAALWNHVEQAIASDNTPGLLASGEWNLDNGRDGQGKLVFWDSP
jgi:hypothetical protein